MISYGLNSVDKNVSIYMNKDYRLHIKRNGKQVSIQKKMCHVQLIDANDKCDADPYYSLNRYINRTGVKSSMRKDFNNLVQPKPIDEKNGLTKEMNEVLDLGSDEANMLQAFIFHYSGNVYESYNDLLIKSSEVEHLPTSTCMPFSRRIFMTVNNKILPCERIGHQYALGEIKGNEVVINCEDIAKKYN